MASSSSSKDKHNFQCVTEASLELIKLPLKDILSSQIKPEDLFLKIKSSLLLSGRNKLRPDQLKLCYFPPPLLPNYRNFDVTLLYTLIRNLSSGLEPTRGWGNDPDPKDTKIGDDIERLRLFRNKNFAHLNSATIPDDTFDDLWRTLKAVLSRLKSHSGCRVDYEQELIEIKRSRFRYEIWEDYRKLWNVYLEIEKEAIERDAPGICIKGKEQIICGDTAEFKAEVQRAESFSFPIKWQRRRGQFVEIIDTTLEKYSGSTDTRLVIPSVCKEDTWGYQASLSAGNNHTLYSNTINLHVLGEKPVLNDLEVTTVDKGIIIPYSFEVSKKSPPVKDITWSKNAQPMYIKDDKFSGGSLHDICLVIKSPSGDDKGNYSCTVTNDVGSETKYIVLDVPCVEISIEPTVHFASDTTITSIVTSMPPPEKAQWQKSKHRIDFSEIDVTKSKYYGSNASPQCPRLVIPKTTFDDIGYYRLQISNKLGVNVSNSVYLNVTGSLPNITVSHGTDFMNRSIKLNGAVFVSDDSPGIQEVFWSKNGEKIDIQGSGGRLSGVTNDDLSLTIRNVSQEDAGMYRLTAINAIGQNNSVVISIDVPYLYIRSEKNLTGGIECLCFTVEITSNPGPCHAQWNFKSRGEETFTPLDVNAEKYQGSTNSLPHPKLVIKEKDQLKKNTYQIKVTNFVGSTVEEISDDENRPLQKQEDFMENTLYEDKGAGLKFALLNNDLANQYPVEKVKLLKFIMQSSGKVADVTSLKSANSAMECFTILQDENIFSKRDVIFVQYLCNVTGCKELYEKCKEYALSQKALCYFESHIENGYTKVQFHVQGDINNYTRENIINIVETVAGILNCKTDEILVNGVYHSRSFMLVLSMKDIYIKKWMNLSERDCRHLTSLHIDYFILNQQIFQLESKAVRILNKIKMSETSNDERYESTRKTTNRARLERIIFGPCRDVLCALLKKEIDPSDLSLRVNNFIGNLKKKKSPFTSEQEKLIQDGNYTEFDITLLDTLLRNICSFSPDTNQWGYEPNAGDISVSANIERIRSVRNQHGHNSKISLSDVDFNTKWQLIYDTVKELEQYIGTGCVYQDAIMKLKTCSMYPEQEVTLTNQFGVFQREVSERMDKSVPLNVQAMIEKDTSKWRDDDKVFIEIHSFPAMLEQVRNHSFVTFVGVPGSGKTATARHIALILQREGYQILPIKSLEYLEKYCDPENPQVFVIDDVLGIFGIDRDAFKRLCMYKDRLKKPLMSDTKIIMTCREVVFRNEALSGSFLSRKKNVILLNSGENVLNDQDEQNLLAAYQLDKNMLVSEHLKSSLYRKMFPLLFKLFSQKKLRLYGLEFFRSPIPCILKMLGNIKSENKIQYASLVLLMANQNKLSSNILEHESSRHFNDMKYKIFSACSVNRNTESFKFIDALSEMIGTYTKKCDDEFSFLHASMFEITAYHFGQQFPELLLQHMSGNYIANYIKVDPHDTEQRKREGEDKRQRDEKEKIDLCIPLQGSLYQMLAERLFRDVIDREFYNVFGNEALKLSTVLHAFIGLMKEMSYAKLFSVFLIELKETFKKQSCEQAKFGVKGEYFFDILKLLLGEKTTQRHYKDSVRAISWVIYHGHHQILQYIIDRILEEKNNVEDLFINFEDNRRKTKNARVFADKRAPKGADYYTIGPSFLENYGTIIRKCNKPVTEEQFRLLCLSCYSGNLNTVRIILSHVKKDVVKNSTHQEISGEKQNVIWNFKPLVIACKLGYVEIAKELIKFNANVNLNDATHTPLTAACENGHLDVAKVLIIEGADVNLCYRNQTPLTAACENGDAALVKLLILEGADVNLCNGKQTPLTVACHMGHKSIIETLIKAETVFVQSHEFLAASCLKDLSKKEEITKEGENLNVEYEYIYSDLFQKFKYQMRLKNAKVNINKRDINKTPLTAACFKGFSKIVQLLVEARADIDLQDASHTPLTAACENGHLSVVAILIKKGADVNLCDGNQTPLTAACYRGNFRIVQMLIEIKVQAEDGNAYDALKSGTCLRQEVQEFSKTEANLNLEAETKQVKATVDINKRDKKKTPLTAACYNGHEHIVQLLLESGADVNLHDVSYVPLTAACKYGHLSVVKLLINANADVNKNYRWNTPLRTACSEGHLGIVEELIRANANINQTDVTKTPLGIACIKGHLNIVKKLIREGAIINLEGPESTVMLARKNGHLSVVEELNRAVNLRD